MRTELAFSQNTVLGLGRHIHAGLSAILLIGFCGCGGAPLSVAPQSSNTSGAASTPAPSGGNSNIFPSLTVSGNPTPPPNTSSSISCSIKQVSALQLGSNLVSISLSESSGVTSTQINGSSAQAGATYNLSPNASGQYLAQGTVTNSSGSAYCTFSFTPSGCTMSYDAAHSSASSTLLDLKLAGPISQLTVDGIAATLPTSGNSLVVTEAPSAFGAATSTAVVADPAGNLTSCATNYNVPSPATFQAYRLYDSLDGDFMFSLDQNEASNLGYGYQGIAITLYSTSTPACNVEIGRCFDKAASRHFLGIVTSDGPCDGLATAGNPDPNSQYIDERGSVDGFGCATHIQGTFGLHRYFNPANNASLSTTNTSEGSGLQNQGVQLFIP